MHFPLILHYLLLPSHLNLNIDLWGPFPTASTWDYWYYISFVDNITRWLTYPFKSNGESLSAFIQLDSKRLKPYKVIGRGTTLVYLMHKKPWNSFWTPLPTHKPTKWHCWMQTPPYSQDGPFFLAQGSMPLFWSDTSISYVCLIKWLATLV